MALATTDPFQTCGSCKHAWPTCESFLRDDAVRLLGLQSHSGYPDTNLLIFEHRCSTSVSILCSRLRYLLPDRENQAPVPRLFGTEECRGHCSHFEDLEACDATCGNARDRELVKLVQRMKA